MILIVPDEITELTANYNPERMQIDISWKPPNKPNGEINAYYLEISIEDVLVTADKPPLIYNATRFIYDVPKLCRSYKIYVSASTSAGKGKNASITVNATPPGK